MPLLDLWKADSTAILQMTIEQIALIAGDGKLTDYSTCQKELREFLGQSSTDALADYANFCLENSFTKSGQVLQDIVNELGRRLDYQVENGRYQGVKNQIGFDGIWEDSSGMSLVIEVKTTDAYRLSLDVVARYRYSLIDEGRISSDSAVLIIVGRTDTGELEAQVRGSKHAWNIRIIGVEALINLVRVKESADSPETIDKIRKLLIPMEYTRVDGLVDIVFSATKDLEDSLEMDVAPNDDASIDQDENGRTSPEIIGSYRDAIIEKISNKLDTKLLRRSRAIFSSSDQSIRVACVISKRYEYKGNSQKYWYAYHEKWNEYLREGRDSYLALGCIDKKDFFLLPKIAIDHCLPSMNTTTRKDGKVYWHIRLVENDDGEPALRLKPGVDMPISQFMVRG